MSTNHTFFWDVTEMDGTTFRKIDFTQPNSSILRLNPDILLAPFKHVVCLLVQHQYDDQDYSEDCVVIQIKLPDLVAKLQDADVIYVALNETFVINATRSYDKADLLSYVSPDTVHCGWTVNELENTKLKEVHIIVSENVSETVRNLTGCPEKLKPVRRLTDEKGVVVAFKMTRANRTSTTSKVIVFEDWSETAMNIS